jgi:hypothetical protein
MIAVSVYFLFLFFLFISLWPASSGCTVPGQCTLSVLRYKASATAISDGAAMRRYPSGSRTSYRPVCV